ncbi:hypothetical protein CKAH01_05810 [Colletotrichum kahawae]|uniref:Uncharacterized protein n=1 Tax=Colletotrichum kahawae TaxID=34407 RepID=A0AAD9YD69_COLKA|nr:hypothetical protein CKAH01_05810 [Colletotrichum kahawae]
MSLSVCLSAEPSVAVLHDMPYMASQPASVSLLFAGLHRLVRASFHASLSLLSLFFFCLLPWPRLSPFSSPDVPNRSIASSGPPILHRGPSPPIRPMIVAPRHMQTPCSVVLFAFDTELFLLSFFHSLREMDTRPADVAICFPCLLLGQWLCPSPFHMPPSTSPLSTPSRQPLRCLRL